MSREVEQRRGGSREIEAILAAALWLFGFVVAPLAHVVGHGALAPHTHHGDQALAAGDHCHGTACHAHDDDGGGNAASRGPHGAHSLLHHGVAAETPLPGAPTVPIAAVVEVSHETLAFASHDAPIARWIWARGPPQHG